MFRYKRWEIALTIAMLLLITYASAAGAQQRRISDEVLRLHVVANSDSAEDQRVKLCVRDAVLTYLKPLFRQAKSQDEVRRIVRGELQEIANLAQTTLWAENSGDTVTVRLCADSYPTRDYDTFSLPAGEYVGLRIVLGTGTGHNWWCVVFPPLCTQAASVPEENFPAEDAALVEQKSIRYTVRFKTVEWVDKLRDKCGV